MGAYFSNVDSSHLRAGLRIYFIGSFFILSLIGNECCKCATKLDLIHGKTVKIHKMTGWVRVRDGFLCLLKLRRLPGGWSLGLLMVLTGILTLVADLAVALLVHEQSQWGVCEFTQGLVMDWTDRETFVVPPANGWPAFVAWSSQITAVNNGCPIGIYTKVPDNADPAFCPDQKDILGNWQCYDVHNDVTIPPEYTENNIADFLYNHSLQYIQQPAFTDIINGTGFTTHYAAWSSSVVDNSTGFDILASIDMNATDYGVKTIKTFHCNNTLGFWYREGDTDPIGAILNQMDVAATLNEWASSLEGALYLGSGSNATAYPDVKLAMHLNSLTMVQGGSNTVFRTQSDAKWFGPWADWYGCIITSTAISPFIYLLVTFTAFILLSTAFYWIYLLFRIGTHALPGGSHCRDAGPRNIKPVPDSILSWMLQASREHTLGGSNTYEDDEGAYLSGVPNDQQELKNWSFAVTDPENGVARMVRNGSAATPVEQVYTTVKQK